jgi:UDP-galactopyranose mutase
MRVSGHFPDLAPDLFIVGAGPVGSVIAERAAQHGWRSLVIDRRKHIGGNCHDQLHSSGVLVHEYGPHYFRTQSAEIFHYLSRFTEWLPANFVVKSQWQGKLFPFPINLTTLEMFFGRSFTESEARAFLASKVSPYEFPANSEEFVLSRVGRELYEAFYRDYTRKQWGREPSDLDASVCGRIPLRFDRNDSYVDAPFRGTPSLGFTELFSRMLRHPLVELKLGVDFRELRGQVRPKIATIFSGSLDEFYDFRLGKLPWRSLSFEHRYYGEKFRQPCVQINYPGSEHEYTRSVEIKHITRQEHEGTVVTFEVPKAAGEPFYPVLGMESRKTFAAYQELATKEKEPVYFAGRMASYRYLNMDEAVQEALDLFGRLRRDLEKKL